MKIAYPQRVYSDEKQAIDLPDLFRRERSDGVLIVVEGIDGTGKTSLATALAENLSRIFPRVILTAEPSKFQTRLPREVFEHDIALMAMDHAIHLGRIVLPALMAGNIVVSDRWSWSCYAYQGFDRYNLNLVRETYESWDYQPDLTILLDMPIQAAMERIRKRGYSAEKYEGEATLITAAERYKQLLTPDWLIIDATRPFKEVFNKALDRAIREIKR